MIFKAIEIVNLAQKYSVEDKVDFICGLDVKNEGDLEKYQLFSERELPFRMTKSVQFPVLRLNDGSIILSMGNEELNPAVHGPDHRIKTIEDLEAYLEICRYKFKNEKIGGPALMTLRHEPAKKAYHLEKYFDYWCLNIHGPAYIPASGNRLSSLGHYWTWVKIIREYLIFAKNITKPVIITEAGNGDGDNVLSPYDCRFLYHAMYFVFGEQLKGLMYYNSGLMSKLNGASVL